MSDFNDDDFRIESLYFETTLCVRRAPGSLRRGWLVIPDQPIRRLSSERRETGDFLKEWDTKTAGELEGGVSSWAPRFSVLSGTPTEECPYRNMTPPRRRFFRRNRRGVLSSPSVFFKPDMRPLAMYANAHNWYAAPEKFNLDVARNDLPPLLSAP